MKFLKSTVLFICTLALFSSCKNEKKKENVETEKVETSAITIEKLTDSPAYENAVLRLKEPTDTKNLKEGPLDFKFEVANYELGAQTDSPNASLLANSGKGQHIHFILNNQPYSAHYDPNFTKELPAGVHHLVAFLSRSYHESVKNDNSVVVKKVEVGTNPKDTVGIDAEAPTLIYSRPKGTYSGKDTESLMLDFFVLNTTLSETGNKVKATINGKEFLITEWAPQVIKGLPKGEVTIELELIDAEGNFIDGTFNKVKRTITLKE
ncbi:hypothetical protein DUT90_04910 [Polaribacter sp. WD7]|uniref:hypothetical protein n=1 Tax=Polaribacter sp. WD7 TaxID=2269061 RepID=UPI000DF19EBD|nr:hypothetical protein [Polaribacter sp. WD7]RCS27455.1 hypothetical protein DUT90_04910 [Polaribacter sp. WD7]